MGTVVLVVFWLATFIVSRGMKSSTGVSNIGLALGTITPALFLIVFMFAWLIDSKPSQIPFAVSDMVPPVSGLVEHRAGGRDLRRLRRARGQRRAHRPPEGPAEELPEGRASWPPARCSRCTSSARWPSRWSCPDSTLELTSGASQAFTAYADGFGIPGLSNVLSGLLVVGALAASIAWIGGPSRSMWLVGKAGYLPRGLQKTNKNDVQMPLLLLQGAVVTVLSFVFVVAPNTSSAFAVLQDISISLYMLMYVCMFASAIKLRRSQPDIERPIRIPALPLIAVVGILAAISAIVLGLTPPSGYTSTPAVEYAAIVGAGVLVLGIPPQFIYRFRRPSWSTDAEAIEELEEDD